MKYECSHSHFAAFVLHDGSAEVYGLSECYALGPSVHARGFGLPEFCFLIFSQDPALRTSNFYTRRFLGGRQPLCGIGVMSLIVRTSMPAVCNARTAASRPEPGPLMRTSTFRSPISKASFAAFSAETCAANGVFLRDPLMPILPAVAHDNVLPERSVSVTITLLNVALTCATPCDSAWIFFFFFVPAAAFAILSVLQCYFVAFFFPATVLRRPLRVRAFVRVRWPRTGRPLRCRRPRYEPMSISRLIASCISLRAVPSTL